MEDSVLLLLELFDDSEVEYDENFLGTDHWKSDGGGGEKTKKKFMQG